MGGGGAVSAKAAYEASPDEIRLKYPPNNRLLLGSLSNVQQPGFIKAMHSAYPVEISVECRDLIAPRVLLGRRPRFPLDIRPFVVFFFRAGGYVGPWQLIGRTETVVFDEFCRFVAKVKLSCPTAEDRSKEIRVELFNQVTASGLLKDQQFLGSAVTSIEDITSEALFRREISLQTSRDLESCVMTLSADLIKPSLVPSQFTLNVDFASITKGATRVFYVLSRQLPSGDFTPVYRSEVLEPDQKRFASMIRQVVVVTTGVEEKLLRLEFYQLAGRNRRCVKLGFLQTSLKKMVSMQWNGSMLWWPATNEGKEPDFVEIGRVVLIQSDLSDGHFRFLLRVTQ